MPRKRGHPPKTDVEKLQSKLWFTAVSLQSGMNANQLERFFVLRAKGGEIDSQDLPHAWQKYANGDRLPRDPENSRLSVVALAEDAFPGTAHWFRSPLWKVIEKPELNVRDAIGLIRKTSQPICELFSCDEKAAALTGALTITVDNWNFLTRTASFEAFGAMVLLCKTKWRCEQEMRAIRLIHCRRWLHDAFHYFPAIRNHRDELVFLLTNRAPELGDLSYLGREIPDHDPFYEKLLSDFFFIDSQK